ncbi:MAG: antitoxin VbhA family protein [Nitrospirae bacterium]|nr:antitoxin VbhA family protein [Nitrospirota bacterium]
MSTARALKPTETVKRDMREAVRQSIATMRLEGFVFTPEELEESELIASGELTTEEARNRRLRQLEQLRKERPELFV